jgi:hypothetical protein
MKHSVRHIAVWIDQREAILATFTGDHLSKEEEISSDMGQEQHHKDWSPSHVEAHKHEQA